MNASRLERGTPPWFFLAALVTIAPHAAALPLWLTLVAAAFWGWAIYLWQQQQPLPPRWLLALTTVAVCLGVFVEYRHFFGRDPGIALLVVFVAQKLLETKTHRDAWVVAALAYFLLFTHFLASQSIATGIWLFVACLLITAALIRLHGGSASPVRASLRLAALLLLQSLPLMLALYLLFPRIAGPLWRMPQDAAIARSGLSETMAPGSIAQLAQSGEIVFRARFITPPPEQNRLYWRGPVMEEFNGREWRVAPLRQSPPPVITATGPAIAYSLTLEPLGQRWLLALDAPQRLPPGARLDARLTALSQTPLELRQRLDFISLADYRFNVSEDATMLQRARQIPPGNPLTRTLGAEWRQQYPQARQRIAAALKLFRDEDFHYTLNPGLLPEKDPVDAFLFASRRGFCEHYASAFTLLMRAAGLPARVVGGYQGGEMNPLDGYLVVRQADAHAWSEVWLAGEGWVRVDPTAAISPARVDRGILAAIPAGEPLPALITLRQDWLRQWRYRWEAINNGWNQWVLGYNPERQRTLLARFGLQIDDWRQIGIALGSVLLLVLGSLFLWAATRRRQIDPASRLWQQACRRLLGSGHLPAPGETAHAFCARLAGQDKRAQAAARLLPIADLFVAARYGPQPQPALRALKSALAALPRRSL